MNAVRTLVGLIAGIAVTLVIAVACLLIGFFAFMAWLVTCDGSFAESGCDRSNNPVLWFGFLVTALVLVVGAVLTMVIVIRGLAHWVSGGEKRPSDEMRTTVGGVGGPIDYDKILRERPHWDSGTRSGS
jgi:hypothetical protein